ncbi:hypothetical protein BOX15_Mlig015951g2, partial [Macrostomum lignano]
FVEFLITTVSDDRVRDKCCLTAVEHAAFNGHSRVVDYLRRSISPSAEQEFLLKAVIGSGSGGHPEVFHIVSRDFNYDLAKMAAESAAQSGKKDSMLHFLDQIKNKNGDVEECNHICARAGASFHHEHIVNYFDIQPQWLKEDKDFVDFFSKLAREGKNSILKKLLPRMSKAETHHLLTESISKGYVALALALVPFVCKQQVDLSDKDGSTALMLAADAGHHELIEKLIKHDASVNAQDSLGRTALTRACNAGHVRVAKSLIDSGANASHRDNQGLTCAQLAENRGHTEVLRLLESTSLRSNDCNKKSLKLHDLLKKSGFTSSRAQSVQAMADCLQRVAISIVQGEIEITGSFAEGWANSLMQVNGRTAAESDIDWTVFIAGLIMHLNNHCHCPPGTKLRVTNGHAQVNEGSGSQPAVTTPAGGVRPTQDLCYAIKCCSSYCTENRKLLKKLVIRPNADDPGLHVHLVSATRPTRQTRNELRVSFSLHEKRIMRSLSDVQGQLFTVIKFIFKRYLPITLKTPGLKTYHTKTLLFFMLEKHGTEDFNLAWQPENLISLVKEALEMMLSFIDSSSSPDECMPHFFMSDAPLYFKNAGIGGDFDNTKSRVRLRLSELRFGIEGVIEQFMEQLRPLQSQNFFFHPFTILPLTHPARVKEVTSKYTDQYLHLADAYCVVHHCLQQLQSDHTNQDDLATQLSLLDQLNWFKCAFLCLTAMAHLKFGEAKKAEVTLTGLQSHSIQTAWDPELLSNRRFKNRSTWEVPLELDWAWRFCFPCDSPPRFPFLPEFTQSLLTARLSQPRCSHLYANFRCLSWSLQAELLRDRTPENEISFDAWKTQLQEDPDLEELLTLAHYSNSREHVEFCLRQMEIVKDEGRVAMERVDKDKLQLVKKIWMSELSDFGAVIEATDLLLIQSGIVSRVKKIGSILRILALHFLIVVVLIVIVIFVSYLPAV